MDFSEISRMMQDPDVIARLSGQATQEVQLEHLPVPVRKVAPDIVISGEMNLRITFKPWMLLAKTQSDIENMVWSVIYGTTSPDLPQLEPYNLRIYREEVERGGTNNNIVRGDTGLPWNVPPGVPGEGRGGDGRGAGNTPTRTGNDTPEAVDHHVSPWIDARRAGGVPTGPTDRIPPDHVRSVHDGPTGPGDDWWSGPTGPRGDGNPGPIGPADRGYRWPEPVEYAREEATQATGVAGADEAGQG